MTGPAGLDGVLGEWTSPSRETRATLWVIVAAGTVTVMAGAILGPVVNQIQAGLDVSQSRAGLIITTHSLFIVVTSPVAGVLVDRIGPRKPFVGGLLLYAAAGGAGLVVESFPALLATRVGLGVAVAFVYTGTTVLIYRLYEGRRKDRAMGLRGSANSFGAAVWPLVGGALGTLSWHAPFGVYLIGLPLGLLAAIFVPEPAVDAAERETDSSLLALVEVVRSTPFLLLVYGLYFVANVLVYTVVVFYPAVLATIGIESSFTVGLYLAAQGTAGAVSAYFYDRFRRWASYARLVQLALVLWTVGFGLVLVSASPTIAFAPVVLFGLGLGLVFPTALLWVEELVPTARQGQFSSYVAMAGYVGQFLAPILFGPVAAVVGAVGVFVTAAAVVAAALVGTVLRRAAGG
ncbi:MAG: MFS transporter [Halobacteriales archaeon]